jgi:AcrR family transcriptional regulator
LDNRERILSEAYRQFSTIGISATKVQDIAEALKMSKKTIYLLFRSKEEIVLQTGLWKLELIALKAQKVVEMQQPIANKLINYVECIYVNLEDVSLPIISNFVAKRGKVDSMMNDYLQAAVFGRFNTLFEQAKKENRLQSNSDPNSSLMMYWGMLSTFLFANPLKLFPKKDINIPINQMVCGQLINFFRGFLNDIGIKEFDHELKSHPILSSVFT